MAGDFDSERVSLKEFLQRVIADHDRRLDERFTAQELAGKLHALELLRRLDVLNHAHEQAREKERDFVSREAFEALCQRVGRMENLQSKWNGALALLFTIGAALAIYALAH